MSTDNPLIVTPSPTSIPPQADRAAAPSATYQAERALFREVMSYVYAMLRNLSVPEAERDDLAQKILIAAYSKRRSYDPERGSPRFWVRGFVLNFVRNSKREAHKTSEILVDSLPEIVDESPSAEDDHAIELQRRLLHDVLLPQVDFEARVVVVGHDIEELDFKTIAAQQGVSLSTTHDRYQRGIKQLEVAYARHQRRQKARGLAVMPLALGPLLAASRAIPLAPAELVQLAWSRVQRALLWQAPWEALGALLVRKETVVGVAFLSGGLAGAAGQMLLRAPPPPMPVFVVQSVPAAEVAPVVVSSAAAPSALPAAAVVVPLVTSSARRAPRRDLFVSQRLFDAAHQSVDRGDLDAALRALTILDRDYPTGPLLAERKGMRARIAELRAARAPKP